MFGILLPLRRESHSDFMARGMISMGDKRRGNRGSIPDPAPKPESAIGGQQRFEEHAQQELLAWFRRPHIAFEHPPGNVLATPEEVVERARKQNELAKKLGWKPERLARFKQLAVAYEKDPTIANYLQIRHDFPEVEVEVGHLGGTEALFVLDKECARHGIDFLLVVGALEAYEPDIDALCLRLLELLEAKRNLPKKEFGFIEERRKAISDPTVNYLIVEMLEAINRCERAISIPASLVVLSREQLLGSNPDLHQTYLTQERFRRGAFNVGLNFPQTGKQISVRRLADIAGVSRGTAARWLADKDFKRLFDSGRRFASSTHFLQLKKAFENAGS
jgi:hypothetical protein